MKLNVLSLFNGKSCGYMALEDLGIECNYFASEVDRYANKAAKAVNPNTVFLGNVTKIAYKNGILSNENTAYKTSIDILMFGSPCQGFSIMGKRLNLEDERSRLFFDAIRILRSIQSENPDVLFLMENVKMDKKIQALISQELGISPILICSSLVSAQSRGRLYWTNIGATSSNLFGVKECGIKQPKDRKIYLLDILETDVSEKHFLSEKTAMGVLKKGNRASFDLKKSKCLSVGDLKCSQSGSFILQRAHGFKDLSIFTDKAPTLMASKWQSNNFVAQKFEQDGYRMRRLTVSECMKLQTIPQKYIDILLSANISDSQLYKMCGNGWTIEVIKHIIKEVKWQK